MAKKISATPEAPLGTGERFKKLVTELTAENAHDPKALAAWIGMHKYGKAKMEAMAQAGKKK